KLAFFGKSKVAELPRRPDVCLPDQGDMDGNKKWSRTRAQAGEQEQAPLSQRKRRISSRPQQVAGGGNRAETQDRAGGGAAPRVAAGRRSDRAVSLGRREWAGAFC